MVILVTVASKTLVFPINPDTWVAIIPYLEDDLPTRVKGLAYWVNYANAEQSCYHLKVTEGGKIQET